MEKRFLRYVPAGRVYEMNDAFRVAKSRGARLYAVRVDGTFLDIGDRKSYKDANELYTRNMGQGVKSTRR